MMTTREKQIKSIGKENAAPIVVPHDYGEIDNGLSKREYFAAKALQGIAANPNFFGPTYQGNEHGAAAFAVAAADALIDALYPQKEALETKP